MEALKKVFKEKRLLSAIETAVKGEAMAGAAADLRLDSDMKDRVLREKSRRRGTASRRSEAEFAAQREQVMMDQFGELLSHKSQEGWGMAEVYRRLAGAPAPKYWISEDRALAMFCRMRRSAPGFGCLGGMNDAKRRMYLDMYEAVSEVLESNPGMRVADAVCCVVNSPAPEHYVSAARARDIVSEARAAARLRRGCRPGGILSATPSARKAMACGRVDANERRWR